MRYLLAALMMMNVANAAPDAKEVAKAQAETAKAQAETAKAQAETAKALAKSAKATGNKAKEALKEKEDCKDKVKKEVEIRPESMSLSGGNAGCSIDDM
ncbi:MAG TPA: hypothetical protein VNJ08_17680 [Bacteriovoracaceae bacterium]|nr:hypothetical protein [Bacteriovoracaceae bacterium]